MFAFSVISAVNEVFTGVTFALAYLNKRDKKKVEKYNSNMDAGKLPAESENAGDGKVAVQVTTEMVNEKAH